MPGRATGEIKETAQPIDSSLERLQKLGAWKTNKLKFEYFKLQKFQPEILKPSSPNLHFIYVIRGYRPKNAKVIHPRSHGGSVSVLGLSPRLRPPAPGLHPPWADSSPHEGPRQDGNFPLMGPVAECRPPASCSRRLPSRLRHEKQCLCF